MNTSFAKVRSQFRAGFNAVPLVRELPADLVTPVGAYLSLSKGAKQSFLLESVEGGERAARWSFLGARPFEILTVRGGAAFSSVDGPLRGSALEALAERTSRFKAPALPGLPRFSSGAVGYVSYELAGTLEPSTRLRGVDGEQARLMMFDHVAAFDHLRHRLVLIAHVLAPTRRAYGRAGDALDRMEAALRRPPTETRRRGGKPSEPKALLGEKAFQDGVRRVKKHIAAGDIFQGVLSERFELDLKAPPFDVYRRLRSLNPSPYMFYVDMGDQVALGASPETLVRVEDGILETHPIAGTRPRGRDEDSDHKNERALLASVKERAEHVMLVDLGRNDVGRVAAPGTVRVPRYMAVERYSHVMHIVSRVTGKLKRGKGPWDAFAACFPAGTVTGAPKIRAMQILAGLEPRPRGLYAGAVVYCDFHGNLDSAIAIRSMLVRGRKASVQAGAGIVADSNPAREYQEARSKARAILEAARLAESGS